MRIRLLIDVEVSPEVVMEVGAMAADQVPVYLAFDLGGLSWTGRLMGATDVKEG